MTEKKKKPKIDEFMAFSKIEGINVSNFLNSEKIKKIKDKFGNVTFPCIAFFFDETKKFIMFIHDNPEDFNENKMIIMHSKDVTKKNLEEIVNIINED